MYDTPLILNFIGLSQVIPQLLIVGGVYALLILGIGLALWGWTQVRSFLKNHSSISNQSEFDEFKRIVKTNMFLALAIMLLAGAVSILGTIGFFTGVFGLFDIMLLFVILGPICLFAGIKMTSAENKMKVISLENEAFREEFDHVVKRWTSSALPDW